MSNGDIYVCRWILIYRSSIDNECATRIPPRYRVQVYIPQPERNNGVEEEEDGFSSGRREVGRIYDDWDEACEVMNDLNEVAEIMRS